MEGCGCARGYAGATANVTRHRSDAIPITLGGPEFSPIEVGGPTNPIGIVVSLLDFLGSLLGLGQGTTQVLETAINNTYQNLVTTSAFLYNGLGFLTDSLKNIFGTIKDWLDDLRWAVIVPIIEKIQQIIDDITTWLANILDPIITFLKQLLKWYAQYIKPYMMAIQEALAVMRTLLSLLQVLGVKWAAKLNADIQVIQAWVTTIMTDITATVNTISDVLGLMVDPTGILRRDMFAGSLFSSLAGIKRAAGAGTDRPSTASELSQINNGNALVQGDNPAVLINPDGSVTYAPGMSAVDAQVRAGYQGYGAAVPAN